MTNEEIKAYKGNPAGTIFGLMEHIRPKKCKMVNGGNRMTYKEAIEMFKAIMKAEIERIPSHYDAEVDDDVYDDISKVDEILKLNKIVSKALEKADKYRWHDLRKNPDDLPEAIGGGYESEYVLVITGTPEWNSWEQAYYEHDKMMWSTYDQNVFAWRYIEPFEEEE